MAGSSFIEVTNPWYYHKFVDKSLGIDSTRWRFFDYILLRYRRRFGILYILLLLYALQFFQRVFFFERLF